jgi:hypothetical protein
LKKKTLIIWLSAGIAVIAIIAAMATGIFRKEIWDINADKLIKSSQIISGNAVIDDLSQWTPFEWDTLYSFAPYTAKDSIYEVVGYRWDSISETVNEGMNQIVFVNDGKVVCYLYGYPDNLKMGFDFGDYNGSYYLRFTSEQKISFSTAISDQGVRYFKYNQE